LSGRRESVLRDFPSAKGSNREVYVFQREKRSGAGARSAKRGRRPLAAWVVHRPEATAMGLVVTEVVFDGRAPALADVADRVTGMTGLPLAVAESGPDVRGDLFDLHAHLAFAGAPDTRLEVSAYRPGAVREVRHQMFGDR